MNVLQQDSLARLILSTEYHSHQCRHLDHYCCSSVNLWRDFFRPDHLERLLGMREGATCTLVDGESISYDPSWHLRLKIQQWRPPADAPQPLQPRVGRWYPQGFLSGVATIYPQTLQPMRVVSCDDDRFEVECNHPLADVPITVRARVESIAPPGKERGGRCSDWLEEALAGGPGMQLLRENVHPDYQEPERFSRLDQTDDSHFYGEPRLVGHLDSRARAHLLDCTSSLVGAGDRCLT